MVILANISMARDETSTKNPPDDAHITLITVDSSHTRTIMERDKRK